MQQPEYHPTGWLVRPVLMDQQITTTDQPCPICSKTIESSGRPPQHLQVLTRPEPDDRTDPFCVLHGYPKDFHQSLVGMILRHPTRRPEMSEHYTLVVFEMNGHLALHPVSQHTGGWDVDNRHPASWRAPADPAAAAFVIHDPAPAQLRAVVSGKPWTHHQRNI